jgi:hypothetical protein
MPLPILETPKYTIKIPSTGKNIEYRPFLVKEEKILLIAQESGETSHMITAMKDIISACTFEKINPNDLTTFDLEYIFLKLRSKSVGENVNILVKCESCSHKNQLALNLDEISVSVPTNIEKIIMLTSSVGVNMRYIKTKDISKLADVSRSESDLITDIVIASIESVFDESKIYLTDDTPKDELVSFINSLNHEQLNKLQKFIESAPKLEKDIEFKCTSCKSDNKVTLSGIQSFFE